MIDFNTYFNIKIIAWIACSILGVIVLVWKYKRKR